MVMMITMRAAAHDWDDFKIVLMSRFCYFKELLICLRKVLLND
jgi:hypothetical protein